MLVSAIMPTRARPAYALEAVQCFLLQTWPDTELIIIDDPDAPSFTEPLIASLALRGNIHYHRTKQRLTIGAKRNLACSRAGEGVITHWDDDDYSAPERMEDQVTRMVEKQVPLTGYHSMRFTQVSTGEWWKYTGRKHYALGTSLMYEKEFWRSHPFPDLNVGEDNAVVNKAGKIATADAGLMMFARNHGGNTDSREGFGRPPEWTRL